MGVFRVLGFRSLAGERVRVFVPGHGREDLGKCLDTELTSPHILSLTTSGIESGFGRMEGWAGSSASLGQGRLGTCSKTSNVNASGHMVAREAIRNVQSATFDLPLPAHSSAEMNVGDMVLATKSKLIFGVRRHPLPATSSTFLYTLQALLASSLHTHSSHATDTCHIFLLDPDLTRKVSLS